MNARNLLAVLASMGGLVAASSIDAAVLKMEYNATTSWTGTVLNDTQGFSGALTPGAGTIGAGFAAPTYVASGAGPQSRAYLSFGQLGVLTGSSRDGGGLQPRRHGPGLHDGRLLPHQLRHVRGL